MRQSPLNSIAQALADGADVDWAAAEESTDPLEREAVRQLRLVSSIGQVARTLASKWGPFEIRQEIGRGAFATVYRAWDPKVAREIALKLLNEGAGSTSDVGAIQEARLLATAEHPNIVPIYGADVHDGRVGIWMKFIHGRTLKDILVDQGPFGAEEAARIGRDLCQALAVVHQRGLVHRDIKAQNVMREVGGRTVLMDFGAGVLPGADRDESLRGSPAYLAPEVVAGSPATPRSDLYSLAVLLYHLVTGDFPVTATSWDDLRAAHANNQRKRLSDVRPDLPGPFVKVVDRGLAAEPQSRPTSAAEFFRLLEPESRTSRPVGLVRAALGVAAVLALGYGAWVWSRVPVYGPGKISSVAILPFENRTGAPDLDFLNRGLAQRVASRLSTLQGLRALVPSNSIKTAAVANVGGPVGVESVLTCRINGTARRIRVGCEFAGASAHAVRVETSEHDAADLVALESELARRVAYALRGPLTVDDDGRLLESKIPAEALALYLRGRHEWAFRTEDALNRSVAHYRDALRMEPEFALAHSGLADAYTLLGAYGFVSRPRAYAQAFEAATRAVALDPGAAESHFSLGYAQKNRFAWSDAEASFRRGLEINPDSSTGHHWYSIYLSQMGRFTEAIGEAKLAMSLDTSSLAARTNFAALLGMSRRYRDAIAEWESCITLGSNQVNTYRAMSKVSLYLGDHARALEFADAARRRAQSGAADEELKADLAYVFAGAGRRQEALELASELVLRYRAAGEGIAGSLAAVYTGLGDYEQAFTWLAAAEREQDPELGYLLVDPKWDPLRSDARFRSTLVNVGFSVK